MPVAPVRARCGPGALGLVLLRYLPGVGEPMRQDIRGMLTHRALTGPYTREAWDMADFYRSGAYRKYERLAEGQYSVTDTVNMHKIIDPLYYPVTDFELARGYLKELWNRTPPGKKSRVPFDRSAWKYLDLSPPAYFTEPRSGELAYVDINACYFQLYSPATLDLMFHVGPEGTYCARGQMPFFEKDWLRTEKNIRNGIIGITRSDSIRVCYSGQHRLEPSFNKFLAPQLWGYMMLTLHAVADGARSSAGVPIYYWNTDGCITDAGSAATLMDYLGSGWGLQTSIRAIGYGHVYGFGSYAVGDVNTRTRHGSKVMDTLLELEPDTVARLRRWRKSLMRRAEGDV